MRLDPIPSIEQLDEHYRERSTTGNYRPELAGERLPTLQALAGVILGSSTPRGRILDVGCFDGALLDIFKTRGWKTYGIEFQGDAATLAASNHQVSNETVEEAAETFDATVNVLSAVGVIEHLRAPEAMLELADRCLEPGGLLLIQTPDAGSTPARLLGKFWPCLAAPEHITYFSHRNLSQLVTSRGYDVRLVRAHWKWLRLGYVYDQLDHFGPEIKKLARVVAKVVPRRMWGWTMPFYGGEMLLLATKRRS